MIVKHVLREHSLSIISSHLSINVYIPCKIKVFVLKFIYENMFIL